LGNFQSEYAQAAQFLIDDEPVPLERIIVSKIQRTGPCWHCATCPLSSATR